MFKPWLMGCHHRGMGSVFHQILEESPDIPDPNKAAIAGAVADTKNFPFQSKINTLATEGGDATINGTNYDFTGLGQADVQSDLNSQMAQVLLGIQQNYGAAYIQQSLADLQQSDPQGYAARGQLFNQILSESQANPDRPLSDDLQNSINSQLAQGGQLTDKETEQVQQGVRGQQIKNGITLGNAPEEQEAGAVEQAGQQQSTQNQEQAQAYLTSGVSPEDIQYRQIQQSLSNLGAFVNGQTPTAQFSSISGAQNGAAPFTTAQPNSAGINTGQAEQQGVSNAYSIYGAQQSQANPFLSGISTGLSAYNSLNQIFNPPITVTDDEPTFLNNGTPFD